MSRGARARVRGEPCASRRSNAAALSAVAPRSVSTTPLKTTPSMSETAGMIRSQERAGECSRKYEYSPLTKDAAKAQTSIISRQSCPRGID